MFSGWREHCPFMGIESWRSTFRGGNVHGNYGQDSLLYTVVFSLTTTHTDIIRGSPKNSDVYVKEFRHESITSFDWLVLLV